MTQHKDGLKVLPELFTHLVRHSPEEHEWLEEQLLEEGVRDRLVVWKGKNIVVDGMERLSILREHKLAFDTVELEFKDVEAVKDWMSRNQIVRRNLKTKEQYAYHLGRYYNSRKKAVGGDYTSGEAPTPEGKTAAKVAEEMGVGKTKVLAAGKAAALIDEAAAKAPEVMEALNSGKKIPPKKLKEIAAAEPDEAKKLAHAAANDESENEPAEAGDEVVVKDAMGKVVKDHRYHAVFTDLEEFHKLLKEMKALEAKVKRLAESAGGGRLQMVDFAGFKGMKAQLAEMAPHAVCVKCRGEQTIEEKGGKRVECATCSGYGWLSKFQWEKINK